MNIKKATEAYEAWLGKQLPLLPADLRLKHQRMAESPFPFLRATFYRWAQVWPHVCPELKAAPAVLGVGDLHVENFGTWRDREGRLTWGINDFDEACPLPYPNDLVRLAVSALLAVNENHLSCTLANICDQILSGYSDALKQGGEPFILAERHVGLRNLATGELRDPVRFWAKLNSWPGVGKMIPAEVNQALKGAMPEPGMTFRVVHRQAGLGSLGRRRFTALAEWRGGLVAREVKELVPTAWTWDSRHSGSRLFYQEIISRSVRMADPCVAQHGRWLLRRLAPDCSRIELASLPKIKDELKLLHAMGVETANVHLGSRAAAKSVLQDLRKRPAKWLREATLAMEKAVLADWKEWARA